MTIPIINDGARASDDSRSSHGSGSAPRLVCHDDDHLAPTRDLTGRQTTRHQVTRTFVIFSGPVNSLEADSIKTYRLATPGKKNSYTAKRRSHQAQEGRLHRLEQHRSPHAEEAIRLTKPVQVLVYGTGPTPCKTASAATSTADHNGTAGGNAIAIIAKKGVTVDAKVSAGSTAKTPHSRPSVIDALLAHGELG